MLKDLRGAYGAGLRMIERESRRRWYGLGALCLAVSVLELLGAMLILVLFKIANDPSGPVHFPVIGTDGGLLTDLTVNQRVTYAGIAVVFFFVFRAGINILQLYLQYRMASQAGLRLADRLLRGYLSMPFPFHLRENSARLIRTVNESTELVARYILVSLVSLLADTTLIVAMVALLLVAAPGITLLAGVILGGSVLLMLRVIQPRLTELGAVVQDRVRASIQSLNQSFTGIRDVKLYGQESYFANDFLHHRAEVMRAMGATNTLSGIPRVGTETVFVVFIVALLLITQLSGGSPAEKIPVLGLFAYSALRILPAINRMVQSLTNFRTGRAALTIVDDDLQRFEGMTSSGSEVTHRPKFSSEIVLDRISFRYEGTDHDVLQGVTIAIPRGTSVGLVGTSGSGKSTLIDILVGLLVPTDGVVRVDGIDISTNIAGWQASLGVVPQAMFLTDDSIRRNIAFGIDDNDIDEARVLSAVRMAQLDEFVASLPSGLETRVAEAGVRLSGGQRQRVVIARALYREPPVLILDEGTSALDNLTEAQIIETLNTLRGTYTVIAVAHRLTSVRACDQIVLLEDGRVSATGTYEQLSQGNNAFRRLAR